MRRNQMAKRGLRYGYGYNYNALPAVSLLIAIVALFIAVQGVINNLSDREIRAKYQTIEHHISGVKIVNGPNVRSEPINQDTSDMSNSYGKADIDAEINVSTLYSTDVILDANGSYYGLRIDEILETPEGKAAFPKSIKKDEDGIVWINSDYLEIYD